MDPDLERAINNSIESHHRETNGHLFDYSSMNYQNNDSKRCNTDKLNEVRLGLKLGNAKIKVNCECNGLYKTRALHNLLCPKMREITMREWNNCTIMKCLYCKKMQKINDTCIHCNKKLASYFCSKCNIMVNLEPKNKLFIKHCDKCDICIYSNKKNINIHCNKCNKCHDKLIKCEQLNDNCPYCLENIQCSSPHDTGIKCNKHLYKLKCCNNFVHSECLKHSNSNKCPLCRNDIT